MFAFVFQESFNLLIFLTESMLASFHDFLGVSIVIEISIVMLIFLLFSDKI